MEELQGKKEELWGIRGGTSRVLVETLLLPISPAKKQAITPPVCLAATGICTWLVCFSSADFKI
jgi:hypothetical protein